MKTVNINILLFWLLDKKIISVTRVITLIRYVFDIAFEYCLLLFSTAFIFVLLNSSFEFLRNVFVPSLKKSSRQSFGWFVFGSFLWSIFQQISEWWKTYFIILISVEIYIEESKFANLFWDILNLGLLGRI